MRRGIRIGIDVGSARVGVSRSDNEGLLAVPVATLARVNALDELVTMAAEYEPLEFVVGLPVGLHGADTPSTTAAREFAAALQGLTGIPIRLIDERLTTVSATAALRDASHNSRSGRKVIDQVAATILLQLVLDGEKAGNTLGEMVNHDA